MLLTSIPGTSRKGEFDCDWLRVAVDHPDLQRACIPLVDRNNILNVCLSLHHILEGMKAQDIEFRVVRIPLDDRILSME